ncbi:GntR family transcriptional regulator [Microvirga sp. BT688]|uniref:GntR family transcriptional regulator n=1 Tax=Microvirga sp. TaxID=1873136 RepID=UPI0016863449|nr:GntR family transcriptional regulator [Microvirga sp.]MBD2749707.1 GntR family transcriptional regulator [Microvirga sp.]
MQAPDKNSKYTFLSRLQFRPRGSTLEQVEQSLRTAVLSLDFAPGEFIDKRAVCARLGVSMFPVSEALARLALEGLVEVLPQRGTCVTRIRLSVIKEFMLIRQALEELVAATAAHRLSPSTLDLLRDNLQAQEQAVARNDPSEFHSLDLAFHNTLVEALELPRIAAMIEVSRANVNRARRLLSSPRRHIATLIEHREVLRALEARDAEAARRAMKTHLEAVMEELQRVSGQNPEIFTPE